MRREPISDESDSESSEEEGDDVIQEFGSGESESESMESSGSEDESSEVED